MTNPHPLQQAIRVWAADPEAWVWQARAGTGPWMTTAAQMAPPRDPMREYRLVPLAWLDDPESVEVTP